MSDVRIDASLDREGIDALDKTVRTNLVNSLSGYKGVNLLGTADAAGHTNLALLTSVIHVGAAPPLMGMLMRPHTVPRHSLENLLDTGCWTLNAVTRDMHRAAHLASARWPREVSEFDGVGLTPAWSDGHAAPYVAESPVQIGLTLAEQHVLGNGCIFVVGAVVRVRLGPDALAADGQLDLNALKLVAASGLDEYHVAESLGRLPYAKVPGGR